MSRVESSLLPTRSIWQYDNKEESEGRVESRDLVGFVTCNHNHNHNHNQWTVEQLYNRIWKYEVEYGGKNTRSPRILRSPRSLWAVPDSPSHPPLVSNDTIHGQSHDDGILISSQVQYYHAGTDAGAGAQVAEVRHLKHVIPPNEPPTNERRKKGENRSIQ